MVKVAVDAMGGDYAPKEIILGVISALKENTAIEVVLVGDEQAIQKELKDSEDLQSRISIIHTTQVIEPSEEPVLALRTKKDSSMVVGMKMVKKHEADAFVSAGSSGALVAGGQLLVGRIQGIERAPLAPLMPVIKEDGQSGISLLVDGGGNVDARSSHLLQFAQMGSLYMEYILGIKSPKVALVNIGEEKEKGNLLVKETYPLLEACQNINFIGNVEAREIPTGKADIVVCDAFVGNIILKLYEGVGGMIQPLITRAFMSNLRSKIGGLLAQTALKTSLKGFNVREYGGAPMLGLNGLVVKMHGNSKADMVKNTLIQCVTFQEQNIQEKIKQQLSLSKV
ncbi:phosphate acyltransferase [Clostridia bacterium]|nr:phosphate acyltransferase [Clostridia bacterium]